MTAKKRVAPRKALPTNWNIEQLDEELRVALGLAQRPGVVRYGDATPQIITQQRPKALPASKKLGLPKRTVMEDVPWTTAQLATIQTTMENHVANATYGERNDIRIDRLYLAEAAPTQAQTVAALKALIRIVRNEGV